MLQKLLSALLFTCVSTVLFSQNQYYLFYENNISPKSGGENLLTIHKAINIFKDKYLPPDYFEKSTAKKPRLMGVLFRILKTGVLEYPINTLTMLTQHEIFGHGYRYREFGFIDNTYKLQVTYKGWSGLAVPGFQKHKYRVLTNVEQMAKSFGGSQANTMLSRSIETKWLLSDSTYYNDVFLYYFTSLDVLAYIFVTKHPYGGGGGDVGSYLSFLNMNEKLKSRSELITIDKLYKESKIGLLNPFYITGLVNYFSYIIKGKTITKTWGFNLGNIKYVPKFSYGLSPFGGEYYFENYVKHKSRLYNAYVRSGSLKTLSSCGAGASVYNILNNKYITLHASVDLWNQPSMQLGEKNFKTYTTPNGLGGAANVTFTGKIIRSQHPVGITIQAGYKTDGFMQQEQLAKGFIIRGGLSIEMK